MIRRSFAAAALVIALATPAASQTAPAGLRQRMDAFTAALRDEAPLERIASFFPRRAEWEFVDTPNRVAPGAVVVRKRFRPGQTLAAISEGGEVCSSFGSGPVHVGPVETKMVIQAHRPWRYAARHRFVPRGRRADSPAFVEWIREDGEWVVSRIGEESYYQPKLLRGTPPIARAIPGAINRDTLFGNHLPAERRFATEAEWFIGNRPLYYRGSPLVRYGLPRPLADHQIERFGSSAVVPVFVDRGLTTHPEVVYVPVGPGQYQPYVGHGSPSPCRFSDEDRARAAARIFIAPPVSHPHARP